MGRVKGAAGKHSERTKHRESAQARWKHVIHHFGSNLDDWKGRGYSTFTQAQPGKGAESMGEEYGGPEEGSIQFPMVRSNECQTNHPVAERIVRQTELSQVRGSQIQQQPVPYPALLCFALLLSLCVCGLIMALASHPQG